MLSHSKCTSPNTLCPECKGIYTELAKNAYERFKVEQIFPSPRVYTLVFIKDCPAETQWSKYFVPLAIRLRTVFEEITSDRPEVDYHKALVKDKSGKKVLRVKILVNAAKPVEVDSALMQDVFGAEGIGERGWKRQEIEGDQWQTLLRLRFYRELHL
ncbi:hypothetical protein BDW74DRAFT_177792 [Aspergillus multicolor]|uniref:uncharacterized protein n=1 Tax=Aspergillus multicolor TaxID=41759 RepID=UPI003CCCD2DE